MTEERRQVSGGELDVLTVLSGGGAMSAAGVAARLGRTSGSVGRSAGGLIRKALAERHYMGDGVAYRITGAGLSWLAAGEEQGHD